MNRIAVGLASLALLASCTAAATPSPSTDPGPSPALSPVVDPSSSPAFSPTVTPSLSPSVAPSTTPSPPPATPSAAAAKCPVEVTPSALAALDPEIRIACYGSTTLDLGAVVLPGGGEIDEVPFQVPARFEQVDDPKYGRLFLVDIGTDFEFETSLPLYVADPSMHLPVFFRGSDVDGVSPPPLPLTGGASITGHFDDPASAECRAPAGNEWPDVTDADAIQLCRGMFIVTAVETGG